jgi:hypothetical protein
VTLTAVYRHPCGAATALVTDIDVTTACGITCERVWWCECGTRTDGADSYVAPAGVCAHLRAYGMAKREAAP